MVWLLPDASDMSELLCEDCSRSRRLLAVGRAKLGCDWGLADGNGERNLGKGKPGGAFRFFLKLALWLISPHLSHKLPGLW